MKVFKELKKGDFFIHDNWLHRKITDGVAIAFTYAASHSIRDDVEVEQVSKELLKDFLEGGREDAD